jgi:hypothetical protein
VPLPRSDSGATSMQVTCIKTCAILFSVFTCSVYVHLSPVTGWKD